MEGHLGILEGVTYAELDSFGYARRSIEDDHFDGHQGEWLQSPEELEDSMRPYWNDDYTNNQDDVFFRNILIEFLCSILWHTILEVVGAFFFVGLQWELKERKSKQLRSKGSKRKRKEKFKD